ncbi:MAG: FapA family protein, partial [Candidatus Hydrogenedentes bacterium]|nr:FapA family protein [Candidatus Hydrogenedentota bacterium]
MSEVLAKYVVDANSAQLLALSLEDMALCQAWYASSMDVPEIRAEYEGLPAKVAQWTSDKTNLSSGGQGARQQPSLRHVLARVISTGPGGLERDELDFLFFVYELIQRVKHRDQFQRTLDLIVPHLRDIHQLRERLEPVHGLPSVLRRVGVATEASIIGAPRRKIGSFGGLPLEFQGPLLRHAGALKGVGDIPDGAAVVVEGDGCHVSGYVLGKLLVSGHAEVRGNVSGLLISQRGNVRARRIVNKATVIAKLGKVRVESTDDPELVYAGTQLRVDETARQGCYMAPRIRVDGVLSGGECHVTSLLQAGTLTHTKHHTLGVILCSDLGCEDYGEVLPREAHILQRSATKLRNRVAHLQQLMGVQQDEAEHYASTALLYMCSGPDSQKELQRADSLKRRRAFLVRMLTGPHLLATSLTARL